MSSDTILFAGGAFIAALAAGLAGFAFALIASALWLHVLPPAQAVPLIVAAGLSIHVVSLWKLRRTIRLDLLWPFLLGGVVGIPFGTMLLKGVDAATFRAVIGVFLVSYSLFALARPHLRCLDGGRLADGAIGAIGGVLGGAAGLSGVIPTIWCGLRGWDKDDQRGVYQPFILVMHGLSLASAGAAGLVDAQLGGLFAAAAIPLAIGTWAGLQLYALVDAQQFRRILLVLLLISGGLLLL